MERLLNIIERVGKHIEELKDMGKLIAHQECPYCFNCGFREWTWFDEAGTAITGVRKCHECGHWDRYSENLKNRPGNGKLK